MKFLPYGRQWIDEDDCLAVLQVLTSDWLTQGPKVGELERQLAARCAARFGIACNSGTAALHMALAALGIGRGDVVVVPANTFLATANAAIYVGAEVRFADVDPNTGLMGPEQLTRALAESLPSGTVRAVLPVHFAGAPCDMAAISSIVCRQAPTAMLIEDACHAIGGKHADQTPIGCLKWSAMTTFSFHPVKHIAAGEGGMVLTDDEHLDERLRRFRCHGMTKDADRLERPDEGPWYYEMQELGFNYRIPDIGCALAVSQLSKLDRFVQRRRQIAARYLDAWSDLPGVQLPPAEQLDNSAWHLFCLHIDFAELGVSREQIIQEFHARGIGTQVHYYPVPLQPFYRRRYGYTPEQYPGACRHYERALSVPLYPAMTDADMTRVISTVRRVLGRASSNWRKAG
jgi:UDP-4-amino-4,6-dideoxy-N-acetyl-beta-L-altrosamine transaminase